MPGKVNPAIPEVLNQVAFAVRGGDATVSAAAEAGQLQLNAFEPIIAHTLLTNLRWMSHAVSTLTDNCIAGLDVDTHHLEGLTERSVRVVTALAPHIGHAAATRLARAVLHHDSSIRQLVSAAGLLTEHQLDTLLQPGHSHRPIPRRVTAPRRRPAFTRRRPKGITLIDR